MSSSVEFILVILWFCWYEIQDHKYGGFDLNFVCLCVCPAVQEERQRGKERGESEVESTSSFNEEMPVDKILDAELAVEPKTETYSDGSPSNSVRTTHTYREAEVAPNRWGNFVM